MPWVKGQSGNPGGRPKASVEVQAKLREWALGDAEAMYGLLKKNAQDGETAAILKILALAGVKVDPDATVTIENKNAPAQGYQTISSEELLKRAGVSSTLSS